MGHLKVFALMLSLCILIGFARMGLKASGMYEVTADLVGFMLGVLAGIYAFYVGTKRGWV